MLGERTEFPVSQMARVLEVSRSGFCSWLASGCPRDGWSAERDAVMRVWLESDRHFRFRFVHAILPPESSRLARYRALKSMRKLGIRGCTPNARKHTTIPGPMAGPRPDLMRRDFSNPVPAYKLVSDSPTCAPTGGVAVPGHRGRPAHVHGGGMVALRPDDHRHRRGGPGIRKVARLRGRKRHFSFRQRRPIQAGLWPSGRAPTNDVRLSCSRTGDCHDNAVPSRSSPRRRTRCTTAGASRPATPPSTPSSSSSRPTTTASGPIRPSATRCRRRLWSRSSSARSPNQSLFPWLLSSSNLRVRKFDTGHRACTCGSSGL